MNQKLKFVVLGGGTAGWLTALFLRSVFVEDEITLIQSKKIGIVGVGEATTPHIISFLLSLNLDPLEVIKNTGGTIKNGISFENWNGDNKKYFHSFADKIVNFRVPNVLPNLDCSEYYLKNLINKKLSFNDRIYQTKISYENKVDLVNTIWAIHFDTNKFSSYLESVGKTRNIKIVESEFKNASLDDRGNITNIYLKDNISVECNFVFDCSGFSRLLIKNVLKEKWISYSKHLPMKKGIPFWLDREGEDIQPYTSAIALPHGWMWKIPLQHRYGAGYIFDSDYINDEQAIAEVESFLNKKIDVRKIIEFSAGRFENLWIKNCIAVGLSSSFIEPLESTSIFMSTIQLDTLRHFVNEIKNPQKENVQLFNKIVGNNIDHCMGFVYLHYLTKRADSKFWREFREKNPIPKNFDNTIELLKKGNIRIFDVNSFKLTGHFGMNSLLQVAEGLEIIDNNINIDGYENIVPGIEEYKEIINSLSQNAQKHRSLLDQLNQKN